MFTVSTILLIIVLVIACIASPGFAAGLFVGLTSLAIMAANGLESKGCFTENGCTFSKSNVSVDKTIVTNND